MNPDAAYVELAEAKKAVRASRRAFAKMPIVSAFVKAMWNAMGLFHTARRDGVSRDVALNGLHEELRAAWPKHVSKFRPDCDNCEDTGYVEHTCWEQHRCQRQSCVKYPERQHPYVEACHCVKGEGKRRRQYRPEDAITAAGKTQKKTRGFTRMGQ